MKGGSGMNDKKLEILENAFLERYPEGFESEEIRAIAKKHRMDKMKAYVETNFQIDGFKDPDAFLERFTKLISKSSLVSVFEKARFKDCAKTFSQAEKAMLSRGVKDFLHGDQRLGFEMQVEVLSAYKMAKWPILTVAGVYMKPEQEVLVKPTTAKAVLKYFEVEAFKYTSKPDYEFYRNYREFINSLKEKAGERLKVDNAAFCGFLMMTIQ